MHVALIIIIVITINHFLAVVMQRRVTRPLFAPVSASLAQGSYGGGRGPYLESLPSPLARVFTTF